MPTKGRHAFSRLAERTELKPEDLADVLKYEYRKAPPGYYYLPIHKGHKLHGYASFKTTSQGKLVLATVLQPGMYPKGKLLTDVLSKDASESAKDKMDTVYAAGVKEAAETYFGKQANLLQMLAIMAAVPAGAALIGAAAADDGSRIRQGLGAGLGSFAGGAVGSITGTALGAGIGALTPGPLRPLGMLGGAMAGGTIGNIAGHVGGGMYGYRAME